MSYLINQYKQQFSAVLKPLGFKLYKKTFYRIIDGLLQTVMLKKTTDSCTAEFNIVSLAQGIRDLYCEGYSISHFREERQKGGDWWFDHSTSVWYDPNIVGRRGDISDMVKDMCAIIVTYVNPLFERCIDAKTAYDELISN